MNNLKKPILLAKIGAPHGVRGELRVTSFTHDPMALGDYGTLQTKQNRPFTIKKARPAKNVLVVSFKEINSREEAEQAKGLELFIERENLPDTNDDHDEFYINDLIGAHVIDETNATIGKIAAIPNFGAGDLLEISPILENGRFGTKTWFLAFTKDNVPTIDIKNNSVSIVHPTQISERDGVDDE